MQFFLIDHSLENRGGHHYDYTACVADAARSLGFQTVIAANKKFVSDPNGLATSDFPGCELVQPFHRNVYQRESYLAGLRQLKRSKFDLNATNPVQPSRLQAFFDNRRHASEMRQRDKLIRQFAEDCNNLFSERSLTSDDHILLTTVSELELAGLATFLKSNPATKAAHWHLQFHFNVFDGWPSEYAAQSKTKELLQSSFQSSLFLIPHHHVYFYTTSQPLTDQYQQLEVATFAALPYPISPAFRPEVQVEPALMPSSKPHLLGSGKTKSVAEPVGQTPGQLSMAAHRSMGPAETCAENRSRFGDEAGEGRGEKIDLANKFQRDRPLRFTCPGQIRREKGCVNYLQPLVDAIWENHLKTGHVKIAVQRPKQKPFRRKRLELSLPEDSADLSPIEYFPHPLSRPQYVDFIKNTDCGLLFYDSRTYYSRRAGVLGELLSCGKPLIVSAGSWLAQQIEEPVFHYAEKLLMQSPHTRVLNLEELDWSSSNAPAAGGAISFGKRDHPFEFSFTPTAAERTMAVGFVWKWPETAGAFCRMEVRQTGASGQIVGQSVRTVGHRLGGGPIESLFAIDPEASKITVTLRNAFQDFTVMIKSLQVTLLPELDGQGDAALPIGSVGVVTADAESLPAAVDEVVAHFPHYCATAEQFSDRWFAMHHPKRTVTGLMARAADAGEG